MRTFKPTPQKINTNEIYREYFFFVGLGLFVFSGIILQAT